MTATNTTAVSYDPYDPHINADPYPTYRRLRDEAPIYYNERYDFWALSRHGDVEAALVDWQTFSNIRSDILEIIKSGMELPSGVVLFEDPPVHTMHRGLMARVFTPRRMNEFEDRVRAFCVRCLEPLEGTDYFDFVADLGAEMPMRVIGMLLGIPDEAQEAVRDQSDRFLRTKAGEPMQVRQEAIANGAIVADRSLIPNTIEETLRFEPTGPHVARRVTRDIEYYGTTVPSGSACRSSWGDPRVSCSGTSPRPSATSAR